MAKAKKSHETSKSAAEKKSTESASGGAKKAPAKARTAGGAPAAHAAAPKASAVKAKAHRGGAHTAGGAPTTPMIDTSLAAQAAAKMLTARLPSKTAAAGGASNAGSPQSAMFKQIKEGLSKPHLSGMDSVLDKGAAPGSKRPNLPTGQERIGHNQTFGADVNRTGVPRRTPG